LEPSGTAKDDDQVASWTEVKAIETRTGPGREKDIMREREPETENLAERDIDRESDCDRDRGIPALRNCEHSAYHGQKAIRRMLQTRCGRM
jgi:hypothetical protein